MRLVSKVARWLELRQANRPAPLTLGKHEVSVCEASGDLLIELTDNDEPYRRFIQRVRLPQEYALGLSDYIEDHYRAKENA